MCKCPCRRHWPLQSSAFSWIIPRACIMSWCSLSPSGGAALNDWLAPAVPRRRSASPRKRRGAPAGACRITTQQITHLDVNRTKASSRKLVARCSAHRAWQRRQLTYSRQSRRLTGETKRIYSPTFRPYTVFPKIEAEKQKCVQYR